MIPSLSWYKLIYQKQPADNTRTVQPYIRTAGLVPASPTQAQQRYRSRNPRSERLLAGRERVSQEKSRATRAAH